MQKYFLLPGALPGPGHQRFHHKTDISFLYWFPGSPEAVSSFPWNKCWFFVFHPDETASSLSQNAPAEIPDKYTGKILPCPEHCNLPEYMHRPGCRKNALWSFHFQKPVLHPSAPLLCPDGWSRPWYGAEYFFPHRWSQSVQKPPVPRYPWLPYLLPVSCQKLCCSFLSQSLFPSL